MNKKILGIGAIIGVVATLFYALKAKAKPCDEGTTKCVGVDLYQCQEGEWILIEPNAQECGYVPVVCTPGDTRCEGYDLYKCASDGSGWTVTEKSEKCISPNEVVAEIVEAYWDAEPITFQPNQEHILYFKIRGLLPAYTHCRVHLSDYGVGGTGSSGTKGYDIWQGLEYEGSFNPALYAGYHHIRFSVVPQYGQASSKDWIFGIGPCGKLQDSQRWCGSVYKPLGTEITCHVNWKNIGSAGYRDIAFAVGSFANFGYVTDIWAEAGQSLTTPVPIVLNEIIHRRFPYGIYIWIGKYPFNTWDDSTTNMKPPI